MKIAVLHTRNLRNPTNPRLVALASSRERFFDLVAVVDGGVGSAYECTNHIDHDWVRQPAEFVTPKVEQARSTSVGDVMVTEEGDIFQVAGIGFTKVPFNKALATSMVADLFGMAS